METLGLIKSIDKSFWKDKKVFVTGNSGFKGSWLSMILNHLESDILGFSLEPNTNPSLFYEAKLDKKIKTIFGDIRDFELLKKSIMDYNPEILVHMAAQPLVRYSYKNPLETYSTNLMGTVNVLESARHCNNLKSVVIITTDKCYENIEKKTGYVESDPMGGFDPYSSSKGCAELATSAYIRSFFSKNNSPNVASVRAGNVIGGGDWSDDRLIPDILDSFENNSEIIIRNPKATRPWQHVIEPLIGYLMLAEKLYDNSSFSGGWNFGPNYSDCKEVKWIINSLIKKWGYKKNWRLDSNSNPHESNLLMLNCNKAKKNLGWSPNLNIDDALDLIVDWHKSWLDKEDIYEKSLSNIKKYLNGY